MECRFTVGQKVVCVVDLTEEAKRQCKWSPYPAKGRVYTVAGLNPRPDTGHIHVRLAEIGAFFCLCRGAAGESWFHHRYFKPLEHSGMSILREIAENPKPIPGELVPAPKKREVEKV